MKKVVLFFAIFLLSAGMSFGQFSYGLKIGYNASKLHTSLDSIKSSFNSGFHFGAFVRFGKKVYLQPELYYTLQGGIFQNNVTNTYNNWKQNVTVGTLDIPVLVGFKLINLKVVNWRIMAGPMASFVVNSKIRDVSLTGPIKSSDINSANWYVQVGTGVDLFFLTLDLRYQIGLNQMIKTAQSTLTSGKEYDLNATNNMWVVSLGFKL
ncbi:MAG: porin family protein [Bacteroidales bacterium]|jgi:hypothetical protein